MEASALTNRSTPFKTDTEDIPGVGTITFRGMSRWELLEASRIGEEHGTAAQEKFILHVCMVDPPLTEAEVKAWQMLPGSAGEIAPLQKKINALSGIGKGAAKSDVPSDGVESDA